MQPQPRPELLGLAPAVHGGGAPPGMLDFSTGVSPLPPPARLCAAISGADFTRYPSPSAEPLKQRLAAHHDVPADCIVVGSGSTELIWALARAFGGIGRTSLILTPTFGEYAQATRAQGGRVIELTARWRDRAQDASGAHWSEEELVAAMERVRPSLLFICRPSNPCLVSIPFSTIETVLYRYPETLVVIDEAYLPFFDDVEPVALRSSVAVLRSFTKVFAIPGVRLGYLLASSAVARSVQAVLPPWNVSAFSLAVGEACLEEWSAHLPEVRRTVTQLRASLVAGLQTRGAEVEAAAGPFVLCRVPSHSDAATTHLHLAARGIWVRDCTSFGLPAHVRLGVRSQTEQLRLFEAWPDPAAAKGAR